jgi:hypothetical protein
MRKVERRHLPAALLILNHPWCITNPTGRTDPNRNVVGLYQQFLDAAAAEALNSVGHVAIF